MHPFLVEQGYLREMQEGTVARLAAALAAAAAARGAAGRGWEGLDPVSGFPCVGQVFFVFWVENLGLAWVFNQIFTSPHFSLKRDRRLGRQLATTVARCSGTMSCRLAGDCILLQDVLCRTKLCLGMQS